MPVCLTLLLLLLTSTCQTTPAAKEAENAFLQSYQELFDAENGFKSDVPRWVGSDFHGANIAYLGNWQRVIPFRDKCSRRLSQWLYETDTSQPARAAEKQALIQAMQRIGV